MCHGVNNFSDNSFFFFFCIKMTPYQMLMQAGVNITHLYNKYSIFRSDAMYVLECSLFITWSSCDGYKLYIVSLPDILFYYFIFNFFPAFSLSMKSWCSTQGQRSCPWGGTGRWWGPCRRLTTAMAFLTLSNTTVIRSTGETRYNHDTRRMSHDCSRLNTGTSVCTL